MNDIIELKKTPEEHNYLKKLNRADGSESMTYLLKSSNPKITSWHTGTRKCIVPVYGPPITEGEYLTQAGLIVKSIDYIAGLGYAITFESSGEKDKLAE